MQADRHFVERAFEDAKSTCAITASMLSCHDLIDILRHKLPSKVKTDADMAAMITDYHRRRLKAMQFAYRKQDKTLGASN